MQEDHLVCRRVFSDRDVVVAHSRQKIGEINEFVVVRRKQRLRPQARVAMDIFDDRPCQRQSIVGTGSPPDLVEHQQAAFGGVMQDVGRLHHLDHERRLPGVDHVLRADAGEDAINNANGRRRSRDETADLRHQHNERRLPQVSRLAAHVRAGDHPHALALLEHNVVRHVPVVRLHEMLHHRMPPVSNL